MPFASLQVWKCAARDARRTSVPKVSPRGRQPRWSLSRNKSTLFSWRFDQWTVDKRVDVRGYRSSVHRKFSSAYRMAIRTVDRTVVAVEQSYVLDRELVIWGMGWIPKLRFLRRCYLLYLIKKLCQNWVSLVEDTMTLLNDVFKTNCPGPVSAVP